MEVGKGWIQLDPASDPPSLEEHGKNPGSGKIFGIFPRVPYLDGDQGLFVIDVDEDVVPGREADVICNRSGVAPSSRDSGIPGEIPETLGSTSRSDLGFSQTPPPGWQSHPDPSHHPKFISMTPNSSWTLPTIQSSSP